MELSQQSSSKEEEIEDNSLIEVDGQANEELDEPARITLIHPHTFEVVGIILPEQLGYETDLVQYVEKIEEVAKQLARGTEHESGFDQPMILDRIDEDGQLIKGSPRIILKESELVEQIIAASEQGGRIELPIYVTESNYDEADLTELNETVVASYTTYFNAEELGRSRNIELSANALNQIIVGEGDFFSFNANVGERTEERGYEPAPEIINKELVMGIGGGICQTSSTLFNAIDFTNVKITERHHHSISIGYVPEGRDATVSYGLLDFKFQNTSGVPFMIKTKYELGILTIEIRTASYYADYLRDGSV